jgi:hypothetical protein
MQEPVNLGPDIIEYDAQELVYWLLGFARTVGDNEEIREMWLS